MATVEAVEAGRIAPPGVEGCRPAASRVDCVDKTGAMGAPGRLLRRI